MKVVVLLLLLSLGGWAQERFVLTNGIIHTAVEEAFSGHVVVSGETIESVGRGPGPELSVKVDLKGQHLYPGLIDADSALGLVDIESVRGSRDLIEVESVNPNLQSRFAYRAESVLIPVARSQGVMFSAVNPLGDMLSGQGSVMRLWGWNWEEATVRANWAMVLDWPQLTIPFEDTKKAKESTRALAQARATLEEAFQQAKAYTEGRRDVKWAALKPFALGQAPLLIRAESGQELEDVLSWTKGRDLQIVLVCGRDVQRFAGELAQRKIPVIYQSLNSENPRPEEPYDLHHTVPAKLRAAGVTVALSASGWAFDVRELRDLAGRTVGHGLTPLQALQAITLNPARILRLENRLGSLEKGKEATMVLCNGNLLEVGPQVTRAWGAGREIDLDDKQKQLYRKYRER